MARLTGFIEIDLASLVKADWNYKQDSFEILQKLKDNLKRNGVIESLIVRELPTGYLEVVNGNHRVEALRQIEWDKPLMVYNLGSVSLRVAQRVAIETNETRFERDNVQLSVILKDLAEEFDKLDMLSTMPFRLSELETFIALPDFDFSQFKTYDNELDFKIPEEKELSVKFNTAKQYSFVRETLDSMEGFDPDRLKALCELYLAKQKGEK